MAHATNLRQKYAEMYRALHCDFDALSIWLDDHRDIGGLRMDIQPLVPPIQR